MENVEEYKEVTLYAKDKEQAHRLVEEFFQEDKQVEEEVSFWGKLGSFLKRAMMILVKLFLFLVLTPFFLFTWLKNIFFLGIGLPVFYTLASFAYYSFFSNLVTTDELVRATFTNTKITILAVVVVIFALLAAIYDYEDQFETIFLL
ncbi:hypothetical protein [Streptococcus ruminantium]|uniref:hypothetical protein n=1 Tax=Streptococcus ruminantium TaxID=1917441 RepID=UPI0012DD3D7E|nr:hypothetical protein [Streptococcus ruminantium]